MRRQTAGQQPVKTGALTILLVVMSICLAALAVLSLTTAAADRKLAERSGETTRTTYALELAGQQWLAQLDALLLEAGDHPPGGGRSPGRSLGRPELGPSTHPFIREVSGQWTSQLF